MKNKRIVMAVSVFPAVSETFIVNKFRELSARRDVYVFSQSEKKAGFLEEGPARGRVRYGAPLSPRWKAAFFYPLLLVRSVLLRPLGTLSYFLKGLRSRGLLIFRDFYFDAELILLAPGVLHFEFGSLGAGRTYLKEALGCRLAVSFRGHDLNFSGLEDPGYYRLLWEKADAIHCLGVDLWKRAQKRGCPAEKKHVLIPPAIDTQLFKPAAGSKKDLPGRPLRLLGIGRLEWKKGYEFALQAAAALKKEGVLFEYRIIGSGNYLEAAAFFRHRLGLEENVCFLGSAPQEEVLKHLEWADVFVHAAVSEGFCNSVLEAQAMKIPVVCTDADGLAENIEDGVTGFLVPRRDPAAMAEKIKALMNDSGLRLRMGEAGRARVEKKFRLEDQTAAFEKFYDDLQF